MFKTSKTQKPGKLVFNKHTERKQLQIAIQLAKSAARRDPPEVPDLSHLSPKAQKLGQDTFISIVNQHYSAEEVAQFEELIKQSKNSEIDTNAIHQPPQVIDNGSTSTPPDQDRKALEYDINERITQNIARGARMPEFSDLSPHIAFWAKEEWKRRTEGLDPIEQEKKFALTRMKRFPRTGVVPTFRDLSKEAAEWAERVWQEYLVSKRFPTILELKRQSNDAQSTDSEASEVEDITLEINDMPSMHSETSQAEGRSSISCS